MHWLLSFDIKLEPRSTFDNNLILPTDEHQIQREEYLGEEAN